MFWTITITSKGLRRLPSGVPFLPMLLFQFPNSSIPFSSFLFFTRLDAMFHSSMNWRKWNIVSFVDFCYSNMVPAIFKVWTIREVSCHIIDVGWQVSRFLVVPPRMGNAPPPWHVQPGPPPGGYPWGGLVAWALVLWKSVSLMCAYKHHARI